MTARGLIALPTLAVAVAALACAPSPSPTDTPAAIVGTMTASTPSPLPPSPGPGSTGECSSEWYPSEEDTVWVTAGSNNITGDYTATLTVIESRDDGFTVRQVTSSSDVDFVLEYGCSDAGLTMLNPMSQFGVASATGPDGSATVNTLAASGITLPFDLRPGLTWQQYLSFEVIGQDVTIRGEYTADSIARGLEVVTVPFGTFDAMRIDTEIQSAIEGEAMEPCQQTVWFVKEIGGIKAEGSCFGVVDSNELTDFDAP